MLLLPAELVPFDDDPVEELEEAADESDLVVFADCVDELVVEEDDVELVVGVVLD